MVIGKKGSGKSTAAVHLMVRAVKEKRKIVTNMELYLEYFPVTRAPVVFFPSVFSSEHLNLDAIGYGYIEIASGTKINDKTAMLFLDEISKSMSARAWNDKHRAALNATIVQLRKYGYSVVYIVQGAQMIDSWVREHQIDYQLMVSSYENMFPRSKFLPSVSIVKTFVNELNNKGIQHLRKVGTLFLKGKVYHRLYNTAQHFHIPAYLVSQNATFITHANYTQMIAPAWCANFELTDGFYPLDARVIAEYIPKKYKAIYPPSPPYIYKDKSWQYLVGYFLYSIFTYPKLFAYAFIAIFVIYLAVPLITDVTNSITGIAPKVEESNVTDATDVSSSNDIKTDTPPNTDITAITDNKKPVVVNKCNLRQVRPDFYNGNLTDYVLSLLINDTVSFVVKDLVATQQGLMFTLNFFHNNALYAIVSSNELNYMGWDFVLVSNALVLSRDQTIIYYPLSQQSSPSPGFNNTFAGFNSITENQTINAINDTFDSAATNLTGFIK